MSEEESCHALIIPLFGDLPSDLREYLNLLHSTGYQLVLVDNRADELGITQHQPCWPSEAYVIENRNRGGLAGGLNCGIAAAIARGADYVTLLDQDSRMQPEHLQGLQRQLHSTEWDQARRLLIGPCIWDADRRCWHSPRQRSADSNSTKTTLLITSGTTFCASNWPLLGRFDEAMQIDYIDHDWCFRAATKGFSLHQVHDCILSQHFGEPHPNALCDLLGMQLYTPYRHFTALRNLRLLLRRPYIPISIKIKEVIKMLLKLPAWLLFEPQRAANLHSIYTAVTCPLKLQA